MYVVTILGLANRWQQDWLTPVLARIQTSFHWLHGSLSAVGICACYPQFRLAVFGHAPTHIHLYTHTCTHTHTRTHTHTHTPFELSICTYMYIWEYMNMPVSLKMTPKPCHSKVYEILCYYYLCYYPQPNWQIYMWLSFGLSYIAGGSKLWWPPQCSWIMISDFAKPAHKRE